MSRWITWNGAQAQIKVARASRKALLATAEALLEVMRTQVPHDEGTLEQSGMVIDQYDSHGVAQISFGGGAGTPMARLAYALRWHEESANFQRGRKHNYMRDPLNQHGPRILLNAMRKAMEGEL
jgi:hypothetical protein